MIPDIYEVTVIGGGKLYAMPRPSSEWLSDDVDYFAGMGINLVVSHLEPPEEYELGLKNEAALLRGRGIRFVAYPIRDRGLPQNKQQYADFIQEVYQRLMEGDNVAVHCRAGIGRTGVAVACLLIQDGYDARVAIDMVSAARRVPIPDTEAQFDFICEFLPTLR